jgi:hypothetical protein
MTYKTGTQVAKGGLTAPVAARIASSTAAATFENTVYAEPPFTSDADNGNDSLVYGRTTLRKVKGVYITADAAMTGATATAATLTVKRYDSAGANGVTVATLAFVTGVDLVAFARKTIPLSTTLANLNIRDGDTLTIAKTVAGAGTATPNLTVEVDMA